MKVIIMAGGRGTRIASVRSDIPKPMIPLCGKPILEHQIECLKRNGFTDITIVVGYLGDAICSYFGDGSAFGVKITYFIEENPLGTAGALYKIDGLLDSDDDFILLCGDTIFDIDFSRLVSFHKSHEADATLVSHPNGHPYDSALLVTEILPPEKEGDLPKDTHHVIRWMNKEDERLWYKNRVNAGIEVISPRLLLRAKSHLEKEKIDLDRDILKPAVQDGKIYAYDTPEYIKDMGTPDRYKETEKNIKSGLVSQRNLSHKQKAVFLDRDGTLNKDVGFLTDIKKLELIPGAAQAVKRINESGYLAIVVTNQPVIARGELDFPELQKINDKLETLLGEEGAYLDAIYFCPHHTDRGFAGERSAYKCDCDCRKPKAGMLLQAARDFNIDLSESYMIGDSQRDIEAGKNAGCKKAILLKDMPLVYEVDVLFEEISQNSHKKFVKRIIKTFCRMTIPPYKSLEKSMRYYVKKYYEILTDREKHIRRAKEMEAREREVTLGNKKLMEQLEFLKFRAQSLYELHESVVQKKWPHDGSLKNKKCLEPFRNIAILPRGEVYTCCSAFLKHDYYIGNIYENKDFDSIWNSEKACKLRYSVSNGNFEYCQATCKFLCNEKDGNNVSDNDFPIVARTAEDSVASWMDCSVKKTPEIISLSCDKSCNLYCSSCRTSREVISKEESNLLYERLMSTVRPMLKDCKVFDGLASGDLFASSACSRFYKTLTVQEFPELTLSIITNIQLLTQEKWEEFKNLHDFPLRLIVSVDGAQKETYEKLRRGAKWETLCSNLMFFKEWRKRPESKIEKLSLNFIIQRDNFNEIEDFCKFGESVGADAIWFQQITNWGTYSEEEFKLVNVFDKENKNYEQAMENLKSVLEKKWNLAIVQNILG